LLVTDRLEMEAELVALGYRFRWSVELFFRWFKCVLGRRHLLSESQNGVTIQVYGAMIASLLLSLWVGKKPTKRS
jgi:IS4 transposase